MWVPIHTSDLDRPIGPLALARHVAPLRRLCWDFLRASAHSHCPCCPHLTLSMDPSLILHCARCALPRLSAGGQGGDQGCVPSGPSSHRPGSPRPCQRRRSPPRCSGPSSRTKRGAKQPEQDAADHASNQSRRLRHCIHHAYGQREPRVAPAAGGLDAAGVVGDARVGCTAMCVRDHHQRQARKSLDFYPHHSVLPRVSERPSEGSDFNSPTCARSELSVRVRSVWRGLLEAARLTALRGRGG